MLTNWRCNQQERFELVIKNGYVLDIDAGVFVLRNIAINEGKIVLITNDDISGYEEMDASGQYIYPGFIDAHCHFYGYAASLMAVDLVGTSSYDEVLERTLAFSEQNPQLQFISGRGWDQNDWEVKEFPTRKELDSLFPNIPVVLTRIDGHAALANTKALDMADSLPENLPGGRVLYADGEPTGMLIDNAVDLIKIPALEEEIMERALTNAEANCFAVGLTGLADAGLDKNTIETLNLLQQQGKLKMPLYVMIRDNKEDYMPFLENGPLKTDRLSVRSIKVYGDGALGSRGALLLEPYADDPANSGLMLKDQKDLLDLCRLAKEANFQVNVHAIGDSANRLVLQTFSKVLAPQNEARWRIEHAQVVNPSDYEIIETYGILPSVQPTHATSDMYWAQERLGEERINHAYAFQSLLNASRLLPLGTDFPVEGINPINTFYAAVTRQDVNGYPENGFLPSERLSRIDALRGMTIWAAYAQFEENEKGSIATGKWADFVIMSTDLLNCEPNDILKASVLRTIVHGEVVYDDSNP